MIRGETKTTLSWREVRVSEGSSYWESTVFKIAVGIGQDIVATKQ